MAYGALHHDPTDERRSGLKRLHTNKGRELAHVAVDLEASEQIGIALLINGHSDWNAA